MTDQNQPTSERDRLFDMFASFEADTQRKLDNMQRQISDIRKRRKFSFAELDEQTLMTAGLVIFGLSMLLPAVAELLKAWRASSSSSLPSSPSRSLLKVMPQ